MFIGEYNHSLDEKGRISVPARFRSALKEGGVVTRGLDKCLFLYAKEEWERLSARISALPMAAANSRAFARLMLAGAMNAEPDKQGRIMVPEYLREYAGIKKNVVVAGVGSRLELWDKGEWDSYKQSAERGSSDIAEQLGELGV
ncbi:division/cell wall cluster transcriptional repressor MraZ [Candidatus Uhrbacteria bacterium]|nr:division/cell wall cluster transcriptional repressor MraZ [Candidatus Uhrbacteria bacterium]